MEQHGSDKNPLDRQQKSTYTKTPVISGTAKGLTGTGTITAESKLTGPNAKILKENVDRLSKRIRGAIKESATRLPSGKHSVNFAITVTEGNVKNTTQPRAYLVEAVADLEEVLQFHPKEDVSLEAQFKNSNGSVVLKADIPLATINARGPIVAEGKALFRFKRNAELFAEQLAKSGTVSRVISHNWGTAVSARVTMEGATKAFNVLTEKN
jgi:hypothetical protein